MRHYKRHFRITHGLIGLTGIFLLSFGLSTVYAQSSIAQVDSDVWYPFVKTFEAYDASGFMAIHTDDVIRVTRDGGRLLTKQEYARNVEESCKRAIEAGSKRTIEFTFVDRVHGENSGYEVGYYRYTSTTEGQQHQSFGKFHVVLKKVDGVWKIAVDSDTSNDGTLTEEDFQSGTALGAN